MRGFFAIDGRTARPRLALVFAGAVVIAWACLSVRVQRLGMAAALSAVAGLTLAKVLAEMIRRLHDLGRSAWLGVCLSLLIAVMATASALMASAVGPTALLPFGVVLALVLTALLLAPGSPGANRFGPAPTRALISTTENRGAAQLALPLITVLAFELGLTMLMLLSSGMQRENARALAVTLSRRAHAPTSSGHAGPVQ